MGIREQPHLLVAIGGEAVGETVEDIGAGTGRPAAARVSKAPATIIRRASPIR
jgi:hypothetical protein